MEDDVTPKLSILLYRYMCQNIVGSEDHVKRIRLMNTVRDDIASNKKRIFITSGSFGEGLDMRGSDLDIMFVDSTVQVYDHEHSNLKFNPNIPHFSIEKDDVKAGFTHLRLEYSKDPNVYKCCEKYKGYYYLSSALFKLLYLVHVNDKSTKLHGPCIFFEKDDIDCAFCFHCKTWLSSAEEWITQPNNSWPSDDVKQSIVKHGVLFVPIGVKESPKEDIEWRMSFSVGEKLLIHSFTHTQLLCYALLKIVLKDLIDSCSECKNLLCSYFMKTIMFWLSEEHPQFIWEPDNIIPCFVLCFNRLIYCVEHSVSVHYFIPESNMFENKIEGRDREILLKKLYSLHSYGWRCILFSDQISNFYVSMLNVQNKTHRVH